MTYYTYSDTEATPVGTDVLNGAILTEERVGVRLFPSLYDAQQLALTEPKINSEIWQSFQEAHRGLSLRWYGVEGGVQEVKRIINDGWPHGRTNLQDLSQNITALNDMPMPVSVKRKRKRGDQGDSLDITRVWSGELSTAWERCEKLPSNSRKYVEIIVNLSIGSSTNAESIFWRGSACLILADIAQAAGYNVAITAAIVASNSSYSDEHRHSIDFIEVKHYQDPLDMDSLASIICLGGWFRYVGFCMLVNRPYEVSSGLGHTMMLTDAVKLAPHQICGVEFISNQATASAWILHNIKKLGGNHAD